MAATRAMRAIRTGRTLSSFTSTFMATTALESAPPIRPGGRPWRFAASKRWRPRAVRVSALYLDVYIAVPHRTPKSNPQGHGHRRPPPRRDVPEIKDVAPSERLQEIRHFALDV